MFELEKFVCNSHQSPRQGEKEGGGDFGGKLNHVTKFRRRAQNSQFYLNQAEEPYCILPGNDLNHLGEHAGHLKQVWGLTASPILEPCLKKRQSHCKVGGRRLYWKQKMIIWRKKTSFEETRPGRHCLWKRKGHTRDSIEFHKKFAIFSRCADQPYIFSWSMVISSSVNEFFVAV